MDSIPAGMAPDAINMIFLKEVVLQLLQVKYYGMLLVKLSEFPIQFNKQL